MIEQQTVLREIDRIRKERKMSQAEMLHEITSERSYRRYKNNELTIPLGVLFQLMHRVQVTIPDLFLYSHPTELSMFLLEDLYKKQVTIGTGNPSAVIEALNARDVTDEIKTFISDFVQKCQAVTDSTSYRKILLTALEQPIKQGSNQSKNLFVLAWALETWMKDRILTVEDWYQIWLDSNYKKPQSIVYELLICRFLNQVFIEDSWVPILHQQLIAQIKTRALAKDSLTLTSDILLHEGATKDPSYQDLSVDQHVFRQGMMLLLQKDKARFEYTLAIANDRFHQDYIRFLSKRAKEETHHLTK